jgi:GTPase
MMQAVRGSLEDADLALLIVDVKENWEESDKIFTALRLNVPAMVILNKLDTVSPKTLEEAKLYFEGKPYCKKAVTISALSGINKKTFMKAILDFLPEGQPFYEGDDISDLSTKFFVAELIREKIYEMYKEELPYQTTVVVNEYKEKDTLIKISADIIANRETQKGIIIGDKGKMIKRLGTEARIEIEKFLDRKVFLELFVKIRPKWHENETHLREYGY